jgi:CRISPR-associated endonuclease Csy4
MDYFIDIQVKPDANIRENVLLNRVFTQFHKALHALNSNSIGVSFPNYKVKLGNVLRIHATKEMLETLYASNWLDDLSGHYKSASIRPVPEEVQYRTVSRKQANMTQAKLRRLIKRGSIRESEIQSYKAQMFKRGLDNPYLELESASNGHKHRRFLEFGQLLDKPQTGTFDCFGLSRTATIPWF